MTRLALVAFAAYAVHATVHLLRGEPHDLLWGCHIAALLVGFGLLLRSPVLNAIGVLWACFGIPLWILDVMTGGEFMPTAILTHVGALVIGLYGVRVLGIPRWSAWYALGSYFVLWMVTRAITPAAPNINLAFHVQPGWEKYFPNYLAYFATLLVGGAAIFLIAEPLTRRFAPPSPRSAGRGDSREGGRRPDEGLA